MISARLQTHLTMDFLSCDVYDSELVTLCEEIESDQEMYEIGELLSQLHSQGSNQVGRGRKRTATSTGAEVPVKRNYPSNSRDMSTSSSEEPLSDVNVLTCLVLYASCAHAIMVKFGTKGGPIEPPPPERELPPVQPFRIPAPVWEERANDTPDPNAQWRPQLFVPQPRYTQVVYSPQPLNNAQRFVNSYIPVRQPIQVQPPQNYFTPSQVLSSQRLPGFGLRYFVPTYKDQPIQAKQEDAKLNAIDDNHVNERKESSSDLMWQFEKDLSKRNTRNTLEAVAAVPYVYQFPAHVARHQ